MSVMGLLAGNGRATGSVRFRDKEILGLPAPALNRIRGEKISMIFQDPMTSLNPYLKVSTQMVEVLRLHKGMDRGCRPPPRRRDAGPGPHPGGVAPARHVSARVQRRHAPARHDRDGAAVPPRPADRGRADDGAGRHGAGGDPRPDGRSEAGVQHLHRPDHPRSGRDRRSGRQGDGDVWRPGDRDGRGAGYLLPPRPSLYPGAAEEHAAHRFRHDGRPADDPRPAAQPSASAAGMQLP